MADLFLISLSPPNTLQPKSIGSKQVSLTFSPGKWSFPVFFFFFKWFGLYVEAQFQLLAAHLSRWGVWGLKIPAPGLLWLYLKLTILMDLHGMSSCSPLQIHILSPLFDFFVVVFLVYHFFVMATQPNNQKLFCYAPEVFGNPPIGSLKESLFVIFLELKLYKYIYLNKVLP